MEQVDAMTRRARETPDRLLLARLPLINITHRNVFNPLQHIADPIKAARNAVRRARRRHRIATDPDFREREALANHKSWQKRRDIHSSELKAQYRADTATYRPRKLHSFIWWWHKSGRLNEWSWRTHQLVIFPDRAAHECTACKRDRWLIHWWLEKPDDSTKDFEKSDHTVENPDAVGRYMCSNCFIMDTELCMPEKYPKEPPAFFTESISTPAEPDVTEDEQN
ncbi:hypothetical protein D6C92_06307 [Aureobasidium pullulans]|nr:hypothetical protein D6C92_06307 [Aureobasidium pullulans]